MELVLQSVSLFSYADAYCEALIFPLVASYLIVLFCCCCRAAWRSHSASE